MTTVATAEVQISASGEGKVTSALQGVAGAMGKIASLAVAGAVSKYTWELVQVGVASGRAERALEALSGGRVDEYITALSDATGGAISRLDAMSVSSRFLSMGLADNASEAAELTRIAATLGGVFQNLSPGEAAEQFAVMLANMSVERLDTFGISSAQVRLRIEELQAATPGLTREMAFLQATMEIGTATANQFGDILNDAGGGIATVQADIADLRASLGSLLAQGLGPAISEVADVTSGAAQAAVTLGDLGDVVRDQQAIWARQSATFQEFQMRQAEWFNGLSFAEQAVVALSGSLIGLERGYNRLRAAIAPTAAEMAELSNEARRFGVNASNAGDAAANAMDDAAARVAELTETPADVTITTNSLQAQNEISNVSEALRFMPHNVPVKITGNFLDAYKQAASVRAMLGSISGTYGANIVVTTTGMPAGAGSTPGPGGAVVPQAAGGSLSAGQTALVGEHGPEIFIPSSSGYTVPNNVAFGATGFGSGGGGGQVIEITIPIMLDGREVGRGAISGTIDALQSAGAIRGGMVA